MKADLAEQPKVYKEHVQHAKSSQNFSDSSFCNANRYSDIVNKFPSLNNY